MATPTKSMIKHALIIYMYDGKLKSEFHRLKWQKAKLNLISWGILGDSQC